MKILVIAGGPFPMGRGTPARTLRVSEALAARGHEVCVAAFPLSDPLIETKLRIEPSEGVRGYDNTSPGPSWAKLIAMSPRLATRVRELLEERSFDVVYAHHYEGLPVASITRRRSGVRVPIVQDSHTLLASELAYYFSKLLRAPISWLGAIRDGQLIRLADAIICVTDEITNFYATRVEPDLPTITAPNGVEVESFARASAPRPNPCCLYRAWMTLTRWASWSAPAVCAICRKFSHRPTSRRTRALSARAYPRNC